MLKVAIAGLGTVGAGVLKLQRQNGNMIAARAGRPITVTAVSARDRGKDRGVPLGDAEWFNDPVEMARRVDAHVIVELIGGANGVANDVCVAAIRNGRHVVTANKALIAHHGAALARSAEEHGVTLCFEAAVAGGIPIIKALREGLAGNRIERVCGILNGTCNVILTCMTGAQRTFADALADAQRLGYAEADPSFDIDGIDTKHKLAILAALAFGTEVALDGVHVEGIRTITPLDITFAQELGYRVKLLGTARMTEHGIEQRVHPCLVPASSPLAAVDGARNAVVVDGDAVGSTMFEGNGAGAGPTASAVVSDLIGLARGHRTSTFGVPATALARSPIAPIAERVGCDYLRLMVRDQPGVLAAVLTDLAAEGVSVASFVQHGRSASTAVPVVLTTHKAPDGAVAQALAHIAQLDTVLEPPCRIRIEQV